MFFNRSCIRLFGGGRTLFSTDKPFATPDRDKGERDGNCEQLKGAVIISELDGIEDGQREGGGFAGDIAGDHDGGSEFTQGAGKGQEHSADDSISCKGQGDGAKNAQVSGAQRSGDLLQARVDLFE